MSGFYANYPIRVFGLAHVRQMRDKDRTGAGLASLAATGVIIVGVCTNWRVVSAIGMLRQPSI